MSFAQSLQRGPQSPKHGHRARRFLKPRCRLSLEYLEDRIVPSTIIWANRGAAADGFAGIFGGCAGTARLVVDAAVDFWERVIDNFNYRPGTGPFNTFTLDVVVSGNGFGGSATPDRNGNGRADAAEVDSDGRPHEGRLNLRGGDASIPCQRGWFLDLTPNDWSEFRGPIENAFAGLATPGGPAFGLSDLFTVATAELTHLLGLATTRFLASGNEFALQTSPFLSNTGVIDFVDWCPGTPCRLWRFGSPNVTALLTTNNGGPGGSDFFGRPVHVARPPNAAGGSFGAIDPGNAVGFGGRWLPSLLDALMFQDAYGYTIRLPQTFGTMHANLNQSTGNLRIRGGSGVSNDLITISRDAFPGETFIVSVDVGNDVPGTGPTGPLVSRFSVFGVSSITIEAGAGNDIINIEHNAGLPVTIDAGAGDDTINLSPTARNLGNLAGPFPLTVNGGSGSNDHLNLFDQANAANSSYPITASLVTRAPGFAVSYSAIDGLTLHAGGGNDLIQPQVLLDTRVTVHAGGGNDTISTNGFTVGTGMLTVHGDAGTDTVTINNQGAAGDKTYTIADVGVSIRPRVCVPFCLLSSVLYTGVEGLTVNAGGGNDEIVVQSWGLFTPTTVNAGGGNDIVTVTPSGRVLTVNGQAGIDTLTINNQAAVGDKAYTITASEVSFLPRSCAPVCLVSAINYSFIEGLTLNAGAGHDEFDVQGTALGTATTVNAGLGDDTMIVPLTGVQPLAVNGQGGDDVLLGADFLEPVPRVYSVTAAALIRAGSAPVNYTGVEVPILFTGLAANTIYFNSAAADGATLILTGATGNTIRMGSGPFGLALLIGGGQDLLDYSARAGDVYVNLQTGEATDWLVAVGVKDITGGGGHDILVGDDQSNRLLGNGGRDLLIGGGRGGTMQPDVIAGGAGDDIVIAGFTAYDLDGAALEAIRVAWVQPTAYAARVANLRNGAGAPRLDATTVFSNHAAGGNSLLGGVDLDFFFGDPALDSSDLAPPEVFIPIS